MSEPQPNTKRSPTADWFVHGLLTRLGDTFDRLLGRDWRPASSLATSEIIERLKRLLDSEVRETPTKARFVPHHITLKMQWDKFSADADVSLRTLENELLTAAVDHINDRRYYTYAPLSVNIKPDYFTTGIKLFVGFEKFDDTGHEAEANLTLPAFALGQEHLPETLARTERKLIARFIADGRAQVKNIQIIEGERLSVGRTKENDLTIEDPSVSKMHGSLMLVPSGNLVVADTGSTNGTFVNDSRISYGAAIEMHASDRLKFGTVEVELELIRQPDSIDTGETSADRVYRVGDFEFESRTPDESKTASTAMGGKKTSPNLASPATVGLIEPPPEETE